jgi:hypothetical protein
VSGGAGYSATGGSGGGFSSSTAGTTLTRAEMLALVSQMHDMIHELMRLNNIPATSTSFGSSSGRPISGSSSAASALDSYGSALAQPISASDSYGSAVAQPLGASSAPDSYGSPIGQTISAALPTYGSGSSSAQLPVYSSSSSSFSPSLATYNGQVSSSSSSIAAAAAASDSYVGPGFSNSLASLQDGQASYNNIRNRRKNVFVASPKFNPASGESDSLEEKEEEGADIQATPAQKIKVRL